MFRGQSHLDKAARILVGRNATLNQRLYEAAGEFEIALKKAHHWPGKLMDQAVDIDRKLCARGKIDETINGMDVSAARGVAEEMLGLCVTLKAVSLARVKSSRVGMPPSQRRRRRHDVNVVTG